MQKLRSQKDGGLGNSQGWVHGGCRKWPCSQREQVAHTFAKISPSHEAFLGHPILTVTLFKHSPPPASPRTLPCSAFVQIDFYNFPPSHFLNINVHVPLCVCVAHIQDLGYYPSAAEGRLHVNMDFVHCCIPSAKTGTSSAE